MHLETRSCTLCGPHAPKFEKYPANFAPSDFNAQVFAARRSPDRKHFRMVRCGSCGIIYSDPACPAEHLNTLYQRAAVNYDAQEQDIYSSYVPVLDQALRQTSGRRSFVEVGGGRGFMLRYGAARGFATQLEIEPSSDAQAKFVPQSPNQRFLCEAFSGASLPPRSVSMLVTFQTLDHLPDPAGFLRAAHAALEPGGTVVVVTHNTQALSARLLGRRSPIFDIEHTYLFHRGNMARLLRHCGFVDVHSRSMANTYSMHHWARLLPGPARLRHLTQTVLNRSGLGRLKVALRAGNLAAWGSRAADP